jgi:hypothetical protein
MPIVEGNLAPAMLCEELMQSSGAEQVFALSRCRGFVQLWAAIGTLADFSGRSVLRENPTNPTIGAPESAPVIRNNSIHKLKRRLPIDTHDANRRELVWQ